MISKKVSMLGMWGVGKTSLVQQFVNSIYDDKYLATLGVKVDKKIVNVDSQDMTMMLWDIAGAEDHFSVPLNYVKGSAGYLLVIDGTRKASLEVGLDLVKLITEGVGDIPFVPVINKSDLDWELSDAEIDSAFEPFGCKWFKSSAKTGENVDLAFQTLAGRML
jgi:small GTP-binding protein